MKRTLPLFAAALIALVPMAETAAAKDKHKIKTKSKDGHAEYSIKVKPGKVKIKIKGEGVNIATFCPPGLAKKNPPCIPPGLARPAVVAHDHDKIDGDHDDYDDVDYGSPSYNVDNTYSETNLQQINQVTTIEGDVIYVGDVIVESADRYPLIDPAVFGLPTLTGDNVYRRVGNAAVQLDPATERVVTILMLANLLIE